MILVGAPVSARAWILPAYFSAIRAAIPDPRFVFVASEEDGETVELLEAEGARIVLTEEPARADERQWNHDRYRHMANLRNLLLGAVREEEPDLFLSLDSDLLLAPDAIDKAVQEIEGFDALGLCAFMTEKGTDYCSRARIIDGHLADRKYQVGTFPTDCLMAAKLMTPAAYAVDYEFHPHGEDVAWSLAATKAGLRLGWTSKAKAKHVMNPEALDQPDARVGF